MLDFIIHDGRILIRNIKKGKFLNVEFGLDLEFTVGSRIKTNFDLTDVRLTNDPSISCLHDLSIYSWIEMMYIWMYLFYSSLPAYNALKKITGSQKWVK